MEKLKVLIACEESQTVCKAFRELGHKAYSCDIQECSGGYPQWHIQDDVLNHLDKDWDLIIAHPSCTYLSNAGARWLYKGGKLNRERYKKGLEAKEFFLKLLNTNCKYICVENPTPLKIFELPTPNQIIQPYEFGHPYSKRTLLWLKGLPELVPTNIVEIKDKWVQSNTGAKKRGGKFSFGVARDPKERSKTFEGIAKAMAEQWSRYILENKNKNETNIIKRGEMDGRLC